MSEYNRGWPLSLKVIYEKKKRPPGDYLIFIIIKGHKKIIFVISFSWSVHKFTVEQFTLKKAVDIMKLF